MSKQLALTSAFSVFALSALALLTPGSASTSEANETGATFEIAAPALPDVPALLRVTVD